MKKSLYFLRDRPLGRASFVVNKKEACNSYKQHFNKYIVYNFYENHLLASDLTPERDWDYDFWPVVFPTKRR